MTRWSQAFAVQAASDLAAYEFLAKGSLPACHRMHYLQMWLEKLCKAYLWSLAGPPSGLAQQHNIIAKILPSLVVEHWSRVGLEKRPDLQALRDLCREIDLLQPQVRDDDRRPDNAEYPLLSVSGAIEAPARWTFPVAERLHTHTGKLLMRAAGRLTRSPSLFVGRNA